MRRGRQLSRAGCALLTLLALTAVAGLASASVYTFYDGVPDPPPAYPLGGSGVNVYAGQWAAQSFVASESYMLAQVDLWAANKGSVSNTSAVEVRSDTGGSPNMADAALASGIAVASSSYGWVSFTLAPQAALAQGTVYWVVLENGATKNSNGWTWWNTQNDTVLVPGEGVVASGKGGTWSSAGGDFEFRTYGYVESSLTLGLAADPADVSPGGTVTLTVRMNNTGSEPAPAAWVNVTLPAHLAYASDNASALGGIRTGPANFTFSNVPAGSRWFRITAKSDSSTGPDLLLTLTATLVYTDYAGVLQPQASATVTLTTLPGPGTLSVSAGLVVLLLASLGLAGGLGAAVTLVARRRQEALKEVFLVHASGVLLVHFSRTVRKESDRDILVGMLTAIQAFIRETFSRNPSQGLRRLDFGDCEIVIAKGGHSYLAVLVEGRLPLRFAGRMRRSLARVETVYGETLARWDGGTEAFDGADRLLMGELLGTGAAQLARRIVSALKHAAGWMSRAAPPGVAPNVEREIELLGTDPKLAARELLARPELTKLRPGLRNLVSSALEEITEGRFSLPSLGNVYMGIAMQRGPKPDTEEWWDLLLRTVRAVLSAWTWDSSSQAWVSHAVPVPTHRGSAAAHEVLEVRGAAERTR